MLWTSMISSRKLVGGGPLPKSEDLVFLEELIEAGRSDRSLIGSIHWNKLSRLTDMWTKDTKRVMS